MDIKELLNSSRQELLDLSTRNRLLSIPVGSKSARIIEVVDELGDQTVKTLVVDKKTMSFAPGRPSRKEASKVNGQDANREAEQEEALPQPEDDVDPETGLAKRHTDSKLQTMLTPEGLQGRLLNLFYDAHSMIEEQGVNILYLAVGHLKWFEAEQSDSPRFAPVILIPVELIRKSASERFHMKWNEDDLEENLSLKAKLKADFKIELPDFPDGDDFDVAQYFENVRKAIGALKGWEVLPNSITLGFFSFSKFLMYRDLDADNWPEDGMLLSHPLIRGLLQDGFPNEEPLPSADTNIDELIPVEKLDHVVDADSSQTRAIDAARKGRNLVIQGPPGTGKSQSIVNIISTAVLDGKKVLFVAEKLAALEVVKRRLEREGLGALCLELHSNKSNKRAVIEEIARSWELGRPAKNGLEGRLPLLGQKREFLNKHAKLLNEPFGSGGLTPYFIIGSLAALGDRAKGATGVLLIGVEGWSREACNEARKIVGELAARIEIMGQPSLHSWRGVCRETILAIDQDELTSKINLTWGYLGQLQDVVNRLSAALNQPAPDTLAAVDRQRMLAEYILKAPAIDRQALCSSIWDSSIEHLYELMRQGIDFNRILKEVGEQALDLAWSQDFSAAREHIATQGRSFLRYFNSDYRKSIREVRNLLKLKLTASCEEKLALIDRVIIGQKALRYIRQGEGIARSAFGYVWEAERTDWGKAGSILDWVSQEKTFGLDSHFHQTFAKLEHSFIEKLAGELTDCLAKCRRELADLFEWLKLDLAMAFPRDKIDLILLKGISERCEVWLSSLEDLSRWNSYFLRASLARERGLEDLVKRLESGAILSSAALDAFDRAYFSQLLRAVVKDRPEIGKFDGASQESLINDFRELDRDRLLLSKYRVLSKHYEGMPPSSGGIGPSGIVKSELERKRGHRSVRKLLKDAGSIVQDIKPVFMMSPLSVAQFLEPGAVHFDLLVIDEASQVQPVDAFGAIARCKQVVVVGDSKQLPPTKFFNRIVSESVEDEDAASSGAAQAKDIESILGLCSARGLPSSMLRWHYRSRHHSLIAVSNHQFYGNDLFIVPSPFSTSSALGLKFNHVPDGVFDSGNTGTNRIEAKVVCRAIIEHARKFPNLSLGVAAFSVRQRQAILDELELLRRECPDTESFFSGNPDEPFFVKNLENVQGDERDVIFISVGYGKDVHGFMAMRFGPLSNEGGERRLNVLISRAKQRCEIFSSITADDIDLARASGQGVASLKVFLTFAKTGLLAIAKRSGKEEDSPFEEAVRRSIEALGYEIHPQVGIAGFFIDLAVLDKGGSGRYVLGIECDGATYHSSRSARDRDRLRQAVLEDHGWIIHRIWSIDWFQRPQEQVRKVVAAIEKAQIILAEVKNDPKPEVSVTIEFDSGESITRESKPEEDEAAISVPYKESSFSVPKGRDPHEVSKAEMGNIVFRIVAEEGPIHEDEVIVRVRDLWGLNRAGNRIQDAVTAAARSLLVSRRCSRESGFLYVAGNKIAIRNRESVSSPSLRKPEMISSMEIRTAILALIDTYHGGTRKEIPFAVARLLGFKTTGSQMKEMIEGEIKKLLKDGKLKDCEGMLKDGCAK